MNWEYIITPWQVYYTHREWDERFRIDNQNKVLYKQWDSIEFFDKLKYKIDYEFNINDALSELWRMINEKWNLAIFENKHWDNIYIYNTLKPIDWFDNQFIYSNILFENQQDQIIKKTEDFCNYTLSNNIKNISNAAKLATIKNQSEFIQTMSNANYIESALTSVDDRLMEDIFLLGKWCHIWYYGKLYLYAFIESAWKLIPIYFNYDNLESYDVPSDISYDKIDVIMKMGGKEKISLFIMKLLDNTMIFKKDVIIEAELQTFYNNLFVDFNNNIKKNN